MPFSAALNNDKEQVEYIYYNKFVINSLNIH